MGQSSQEADNELELRTKKKNVLLSEIHTGLFTARRQIARVDIVHVNRGRCSLVKRAGCELIEGLPF